MKGHIIECIYVHEIRKLCLTAKGSNIPQAGSCSHNVIVIKGETYRWSKDTFNFSQKKKKKIDPNSKRLEIDYGLNKVVKQYQRQSYEKQYFK